MLYPVDNFITAGQIPRGVYKISVPRHSLTATLLHPQKVTHITKNPKTTTTTTTKLDTNRTSGTTPPALTGTQQQGEKMNEPHITLQGRLTKDPEIRFGKTGCPFTTFTIATNIYKKDKETDTTTEQVTFWDIICFSQTAEKTVELLEKGASVWVDGKYTPSQYTDKDGKTRITWKITADTVALNSFDFPKYQKKNN